MKGLCPSVVCFLLMLFGASAHADMPAEEMLKAIVKIKATVPKEAFTSSALGTEREGHGVLIDAEGHILTIGRVRTETRPRDNEQWKRGLAAIVSLLRTIPVPVR